MKRMFLPVGQGAFYCEKFTGDECGRVINVVYDCGTLSGLSNLRVIIYDTFKENETIDALFISHLHEDHINGIPLLTSHCHVKRVYLPLISPTDLALMKLDFETRSRPQSPLDKMASENYGHVAEDFVRSMLDNPHDALLGLVSRDNRNMTIEGLNCYTTETDTLGVESQGVYDLSDAIFNNVVTGTGMQLWRYKTFCIRNDIAVHNVIQRLKATFGGEVTPERIAELVKESCGNKKTRTNVRKLYDGLKDKFNSHSLTMCSWSTASASRQLVRCCQRICGVSLYGLHRKHSGCLYTGDFEASNRTYWRQLKLAYQECWSKIGCVQIPHHGSQHNFNNDFLAMDAYNVISAGFGNNYHHPSKNVLAQCQRKKQFPFVVTQDPHSLVCADVNIR